MIYFIESGPGGPIKIGHTSRFEEIRLAELQTGNPVTLRILATTTGGRELEQMLHEQFQDHLIHGEWFHPEDDILEFIEGLSDQR